MGRLRARAVTTVAALVASTVTMVGLSGPASAAPSTVDTPFTYTGTVQSFTVPDGITQLTLTLTGAEGGSGGPDGPAGRPGGYKGVLTGTVTVTPGTVMSIGVGKGGNSGAMRSGATNNVTTLGGTNPLGGYAGGGGGIAGPEGASGNGGGGGAATVISFGSTTLVAGGAGGGGGSGQYAALYGRPGEAVPTARTDAASTTGQTGLNTINYCGGGRCDGGASGGGGGGAVGGARGLVEFGAGANTEYFGYGGYPGTSATGGLPGLTAVYQFYAGNNTNGSVSISYVTGSPAAPTSVAGTAGNAAVDLTWGAPTSTGGSPVTDYVVEYSADGGTNWSTFSHAPSAATAGTVTGLTNGTAYVFRVSAVNSFGTGTVSTVSGPVTPSNVPTAPTLGAVVPGNGSLTIPFSGATAASPITGYEYAVDGGAWIPAGTTTSPLTITGLTNGSTHEVQVRAVNAIGAGAASTGVTGTPATTPGAPSITTATTGPTSAVLVFSPGASGGSTVTGYQYSLDGGPWIDAGATTSPITVTGLTDGTLYAARIRAVNALGTGAASNPVNLTTSNVPGAPTIDTVTPLNGALSVAFAPSGTGGLAVTGYEYQLDGGTWVAADSTASPLLISGLTNGTVYGVKIRAVNAVGSGTSSTTATGSPLTVPGAPTLTARGETESGLEISFTAPTSTGGSAITGYEYSTDGGLTWRARPDGTTGSPLAISTLSSDGTSPLEDGVDYPIELRAVNSAGSGAASSILSASGRTAPAAPTIADVTGRPAALLVTVTPPANGGEEITGYEYRLDGGDWTSTGTAGPSFVIGGLTNGTSYGVEVRALNAIDAGEASASVSGTPVAAPGAAVITDVAPVDRALRITASVADDGGSAVTGWEYTTDGGLTWAAAGTSSPFTITHLSGSATLLDNASSYAVAVRARNAVGAGGSSSTVSAAPSATPAAPTATLTPGNGSLQVAYTIGSDGGSPLTDVQYRLDGGSWVGAGTITSPFVISGLTNGTSYAVELRGVNSRGQGAVSASVAGTPRTVPGAPTGVAVVSETMSATVSWTAPASTGGTPVTGYTATAWSAPNGGTAAGTCTGSTLTCSISGLTNGTTYYVSVVATNVAGTGPASAPRVAVTPLARPSAPTLTSITPNNTYVSVAFTAGAAGSSPITGYQYQLNGGAWVNAASATSPITISGLTNGTAYDVALRAVSAAGPGAASNVLAATPFTLPDVPDSATIVGTGGVNTITVTWAAVNGNGRPVTGYNVVLWSAANLGAQSYLCSTTGALSCTITGPGLGATYYATVDATNAAGTTVRSAPRVPVASGTAPGAPNTVVGTSGDGQVTLTWSAGPAGTGAAVSDYAVSYSTDGVTWTPFADGVSTSRTATVTGLTNGTAYTFKVQALSPSGPSPVSAASAAVTPSGIGTVPTFGTVTRTADGFTTSISNYNAVVGYTATATNGGTATITGSTLTVTGLAAGTASTVTVTATRAGYTTVSGTVSGTSLQTGTDPTFGPVTRTATGYTVAIADHDPAVTYSATATSGTVTISGATLTVAGLAPGASSNVTVTATRAGYTTTTGTVSGNALVAGVAPTFGAVTRTIDGWTVEITNLDDSTTYALTTSGTASATLAGTTLTVTGLSPGTSSTVTVVAGKSGSTLASAPVTGAALVTGTAPTFGPVIQLTDGFSVEVTEPDPAATYTATSTVGTASVTIVEGVVTVTIDGLAAGQSAEVTVTVTTSGSTTVTGVRTGSALLAGTAPELADPIRTVDGFSVEIVEPDPDVVYTAVSDAGTATVVAGVVTVAGLTPGQEATVTVTATRTGYTTETTDVTGNALQTGSSPVLSSVTRTSDGYTLTIDSVEGYTYEATATSGSATVTVTEGVTTLTVTGLAPGESATVTVVAVRDGYTVLPSTATGVALRTGTAPVLAGPSRTPDGFTVEVDVDDTDPVTEYTAVTTAGEVSIVNGLVTVTGLAPGQEATVTVTATREGYTSPATAVSGRALETGTPVVLSEPTRTDAGYTVTIDEVDPGTEYTAAVSAGSVSVIGDAVVVTGLAPNQSATVTVTATKTGFTTETATATGAALRVGSLPELSPVTPTRDGFVVTVLNADPNSTYGVNAGTGTATVTTVDGVVTVTVTGLEPEQSATIVVYATREGYSTLETPVTGSALASGTAPVVGTAVRTADGFSFPVTVPVTDPATTFVATSTAGVVTLVDGIVTVTGLTPGQTATVTVSAIRAGYATETTAVTSGALYSGTVPTVPPAPTRTTDGFAFAITDPVPGTTYTATATAGVVTVVDGIVTVTGLTPGETATVTVTAARDGETPETVEVTGSALGTGTTPTLGAPTPNADGFTVTIANPDPDTVYTATTTAGTVTIVDGVVTVTGLAPGQTATLTVTATRPGFTPGTATTTGVAPTPVQLTLTGGDTIVVATSTPVISGYADAPEGSPVTVTVNGQTLTTTVGPDGYWSVTPAALPDGEYDVEVSITVLGVTTTLTQKLTVDTAGTPSVPFPTGGVPPYAVPPVPTPASDWTGTDGLAYTGLDTRLPGTVGVGLLVLGALFLGFARRRRPAPAATDAGSSAPPAV